MLLDPEKPLPQDVLRDLLGGAEFEKFMEVLDDPDNCSLLTPESVESSAVCGDFLDPEAANPEENSYLPSNYLKAIETVGPLISLSSPLQKLVAAETSETDAADQLQISANAEPSTAKVILIFMAQNVRVIKLDKSMEKIFPHSSVIQNFFPCYPYWGFY